MAQSASAKIETLDNSANEQIKHPCSEQSICRMMLGEVCTSCGLTREEYNLWMAYTAIGQRRVLERIALRMQK